jgi:ribosomal protein L15
VKLLWAGELKSKVTLTVDSASTSAQEAFKNAGGTLNLSKVESE